MVDTIVQAGTVVSPEQTTEMDVAIQDGEIVNLASPGSLEDAERIINASGKYVFPGLIDSHVHVNLPLGDFVTKDGFSDASRAAAFGGTTTIIPFAVPDSNESPLEAYERRRDSGDGSVYTDYGLHGCLTEVTDATLDEIPIIIDRGAASIKMFMVYKEKLMLSDGEIRDALGTIRESDGLALIHAENENIIQYLTSSKTKDSNAGFSTHPSLHPDVSETTAMWTITDLVEETRCPTFFVHVSTGDAKKVLRSANERNLPLLGETCPHYLSMSDEVYTREDGEKYVCSPPMRSDKNRSELWNMVIEGDIKMINSDHGCFDTEQKERYRDDVTKMPMGLPGVETRNMVFYTDSVARGRLPVEKFVELTSTNVAKIFGLYPKKGAITPGADADIVIFDPMKEWKITNDNHHMATDYTPFSGKNMKGKPTMTMVGGEVVIEDNKLVGDKSGEFIPTSGESAEQVFTRGI